MYVFGGLQVSEWKIRFVFSAVSAGRRNKFDDAKYSSEVVETIREHNRGRQRDCGRY